MAYTTIDKSSLFMNTLLYTGTGAELANTGVGFQPDFCWIKERTGTEAPSISDSVRGATYYTQPNTTGAQGTDAQGLKSFDSDGFTVGTSDQFNTNTETYIGWNWKAGTTSGLTGGTITPTAYSFNTTSKFSIIQYEGTGVTGTIPHGLGVAPRFIIFKSQDNASMDWSVYHYGNAWTVPPLPGDYYTSLNLTAYRTDNTSWFNDTTATSTVFTVGGGSWEVNQSGYTIMAYCFANVPGYSQFGNYIGNGNADGAFVYCGFKPSFVLLKCVSTGAKDWHIIGNKNLGYNPDNNTIYANTNAAEQTDDRVSLYATGFKMTSTSGDFNTNGEIYCYSAFGQSIVGSNDVIATAR